MAPAPFREVLVSLDFTSGRQFAVKHVDLGCDRAQVTVNTQIQVVESIEHERSVHRKMASIRATTYPYLKEEVQCGDNLYLFFPFCSVE